MLIMQGIVTTVEDAAVMHKLPKDVEDPNPAYKRTMMDAYYVWII